MRYDMNGIAPLLPFSATSRLGPNRHFYNSLDTYRNATKVMHTRLVHRPSARAASIISVPEVLAIARKSLIRIATRQRRAPSLVN
jgi:hypothetical protein